MGNEQSEEEKKPHRMEHTGKAKPKQKPYAHIHLIIAWTLTEIKRNKIAERERKKNRIVFPARQLQHCTTHIKQNITLLMCCTFAHSMDILWLFCFENIMYDLETGFHNEQYKTIRVCLCVYEYKILGPHEKKCNVINTKKNKENSLAYTSIQRSLLRLSVSIWITFFPLFGVASDLKYQFVRIQWITYTNTPVLRFFC